MLTGTIYEDVFRCRWCLRDESNGHGLHDFQEHHQVEILINGQWVKASVIHTPARWTPKAPGLELANGLKVRILNAGSVVEHGPTFKRPDPRP